jgi:peptidyl-prolyl cis-trans isomerase C
MVESTMLWPVAAGFSNGWGSFVRSKIVLALSLSLLAAGCNKKAEGQTVAIVNGEEITAAELNAELAAARLPDGADRNQARSRILQAMIDRRLLAQQAKKDGLDKSPDYLNRKRKMDEELLIRMLASRQIDTAQLPSNAEVERYQASHPSMFARREQWNLDQLRFQMPTDAAVVAKLKEAKSLDQVGAVLTEAGISFTRQKNRLDTAVIPQALYGQLSSAGSEPFIIPVGTQAVASVITSREPAAITGDQAKPVAVQAIRREQAAKLMQNRLTSVRQAAKIEYKEGFAPPKK